jgi:hypothetical protein
LVGPAQVGIDRRAHAIGDRIAKGHNAALGPGAFHIHTGHQEAPGQNLRPGQIGSADLIAGRHGGARGGIAMEGGGLLPGGQMERHRHPRQRRQGERDGIAGHRRMGRHHHAGTPAHGHAAAGARDDAPSGVHPRDLDMIHGQRRCGIGVVQHQPNLSPPIDRRMIWRIVLSPSRGCRSPGRGSSLHRHGPAARGVRHRGTGAQHQAGGDQRAGRFRIIRLSLSGIWRLDPGHRARLLPRRG